MSRKMFFSLFNDFFIYALDVPVVNVLQLSYSTNIGSSITLRCTVTSNPTHNSVYWQRTINGQTSQITTSTNTNKYSGSTVNTPSLTINNVAQSDAGSYRCLADNSIGTGQSQITVLNVAGSKYLVVHINIQGSLLKAWEKERCPCILKYSCQ